MGGAGVFSVIHAVTEARNFFLLCQHVADIGDGVCLFAVHGFEDAKNGFFRSAVQRSLQSTDRRSYGRVHVRKRGGSYAGRECGSIEFMIGVKDQGNIERAFGSRRWLYAIELKQ